MIVPDKGRQTHPSSLGDGGILVQGAGTLSPNKGYIHTPGLPVGQRYIRPSMPKVSLTGPDR